MLKIGKKRAIVLAVVLSVLLLSGVAAIIIADEVGEKPNLPIVTEEDSGITVKNVWASDVTRASATLNLKISKTFVSEYKIYLGESPDSLKEVSSASIGKSVSSVTASLDGLSEYTRYYYCFHLLTSDSEVVLDTWSFVTPNSYYSGAAGGKNDENASYGIDVSFWCKSSDFEKAKADGVEFVIIRAGSSGNKDPYFEENYERAKAAGLRVGAYYYTYAMSLEEAYADVDEYLEFICGKQFDMPVYVDIEEEKQQDLPRQLLTEMMISFCDKIADAGYYPGVYANRNWFNTLLNYDTLAPVYELWLAKWTYDGLPDEDHSDMYGIWQYYDQGKVDGVQGNADLNVCYKDYSSIINNDGTVPYDFVDWDGSVVCRYYMYPGVRIYTPSKIPTRPSDDLYSYEFVGWKGLDENTVALEGGGSFEADYEKMAHSYGEWEEIWVMERTRTCEDCGYVQHETLGDLTCGENATWYFEDGKLVISGSGAIRDGKQSSDLPWSVVASEVTKLTISDGITSIGDYAFADLPNLSSVQLPLTLASIGEYAFANCRSLSSITIPAATSKVADNAFYGCTLLNFIGGYDTDRYQTAKIVADKIGANYKTVKARIAYYGKIGDSINWHLYSDGHLLVSGVGSPSADLSYDIEHLGGAIVTVTFGAGVNFVPEGFMIGVTTLQKVEFLGDSPVSIGQYAFRGCTDLCEINIPRGSDIAYGALIDTPLVQ